MSAKRQQRMPRSASSIKIGRAVKRLKTLPMSDHFQLMVKAGLMTQEEADQAKRKVAETTASSE